MLQIKIQKKNVKKHENVMHKIEILKKSIVWFQFGSLKNAVFTRTWVVWLPAAQLAQDTAVGTVLFHVSFKNTNKQVWHDCCCIYT